MTAFDDAAAALHADPNISLPALYRAGGAGAGTPIRVIYSEPVRTEGFGSTGKAARDLKADVLLAAAPAIARDDTLQIGVPGDVVEAGDPLFVVAVVEIDDQAITATVTLRPGP